MNKIIIILGAIALLGIGSYFFFRNHPAISSIAPPQILSLEQIAQRDNDALVNKNYDLLWDDMYPDDKTRWNDKQDYINHLEKINEGVEYVSINFKESKDLVSWTHPITGNSYKNVKEITSSNVYKNQPDPVNAIYIYAKSGDRWYFFSQALSESDRERVKAQATAGPSYKELSKNPDKFKSVKAKYTGKITQIQEGSNGSGFLKLALTNGGYGYWSDEIYVSYSTSTEFLEGDMVTVYGIMSGAVTFTSVANYNITLPGMEAVAIEKPSVKNTSPKTYNYNIGDTVKVGNYSLVVNSSAPCTSEYPDSYSGQTIAVQVTQTNAGSVPLKYNMYDFMLIDNLGQSYSPIPILCPGTQLIGNTINPGKSISGYFGFEIPQYVQPTALETNPITMGSKDLYVIKLK